MPKHSSHILELARKGAEHRYDELKAAIATLVTHFPHLRRRKTTGKMPFPFELEQRELPHAPRRATISAGGRKAIGDAQRKRWAKMKAGKNQ